MTRHTLSKDSDPSWPTRVPTIEGWSLAFVTMYQLDLWPNRVCSIFTWVECARHSAFHSERTTGYEAASARYRFRKQFVNHNSPIFHPASSREAMMLSKVLSDVLTERWRLSPIRRVPFRWPPFLRSSVLLSSTSFMTQLSGSLRSRNCIKACGLSILFICSTDLQSAWSSSRFSLMASVSWPCYSLFLRYPVKSLWHLAGPRPSWLVSILSNLASFHWAHDFSRSGCSTRFAFCFPSKGSSGSSFVEP